MASPRKDNMASTRKKNIALGTLGSISSSRDRENLARTNDRDNITGTRDRKKNMAKLW